MTEEKSCVKFPTENSRDEILITSMRVLIVTMRSIGDFVNIKMVKAYGDNWISQIPVCSYENRKGRIQKLEQIFDISVLSLEVCNNPTSMFRDCFKEYNEYEKRRIYELLWKVKKIRDGVVHNSILQTTLLIELCEVVELLFRFLHLTLCFNPQSLILRVNALLSGEEFTSDAANLISEEERETLDRLISDAALENKVLSEEVDRQTRQVIDLIKEISILKSVGDAKKLGDVKSQYREAVSRRSEAINNKNINIGKKSIVDEFMNTYFQIDNFDKLLKAYAQLNDSTNGYIIGEVYEITSLRKMIKFSVPLTCNKITIKGGASGVDYLTIKENELYLLLRSLRPEGGVFFVDKDFEVFFQYKDKRKEIVLNKYVFAGNVSKCLLFT